MSMPVEALEAALLSLPKTELTRLLNRVIASLDDDAARDAAWDALAAARDAEIESGQVQALDGEAVLSRLRAELA